MNVFKGKKRPLKSRDSVRSLQSRESNNSLSLPQETPQSEVYELDSSKMKFTWILGETMTYGVFSGVSVVSGNIVYFKDGGTSDIYEYNISRRSWSRLTPSPPFVGYGMAMLNNNITTIGGFTPQDRQDTNKVMSYVNEKWVELYPHMPTARHYTTCVASANTLVVAGGSIKNNSKISTVEILDLTKKVWSFGVDLPLPLSSPISTLCGEDLYVTGGFNSNGKQSNVAICCSIPDLIRSSTPALDNTVTPETKETGTFKIGFPWRELPDAPLCFSSCVSINGSLVLTGGMKSSKKPSGEIYRYEPTEFTWELVGTVPTPRYCSVAASIPSSKELMVVGGLNGPIGSDHVTNFIETATF